MMPNCSCPDAFTRNGARRADPKSPCRRRRRRLPEAEGTHNALEGSLGIGHPGNTPFLNILHAWNAVLQIGGETSGAARRTPNARGTARFWPLSLQAPSLPPDPPLLILGKRGNSTSSGFGSDPCGGVRPFRGRTSREACVWPFADAVSSSTATRQPTRCSRTTHGRIPDRGKQDGRLLTCWDREEEECIVFRRLSSV